MSDREELDQRYQDECDRWPGRKVEIINGRIVVRESATFDHAKVIYWLLLQLIPSMTEREWLPVWDLKLFLGVQKDRYKPDHVVKPRNCAAADVPLYLVIDAFKNQVRLLSRPSETGYAHETLVKLGDPLDLPAPWNLTIDTGKLIEE
ncbi:hypothetical protein FHR32_001334 [Streptosporangium album]|uniref:Restriction endonuclease domain-containing protein n=1 Tax=Streptosporangium album TaxID=47479 RepID=A0A7W7RRV1_9ACTN|nr:hypothetical protein [Streptosporangium album]MBB4937029.1 hypothetical protein [Streptosporangium album]